MQFAKRMFMGLGVVAFMAMLFSLAAPKAVHGLVATLVQVANTAANPVPDKDVDNPGRATLVVAYCDLGSLSGSSGDIYCVLPYTVPATDRLVIQQVEAECSTPKGNNLVGTNFTVTTNGNPYAHQLLLQNEGASPFNNDAFVADQAVHFYADPGSTLEVDTFTTDLTGSTSCQVAISGYLISYP
jgi:hypothetical protein